MEYSLEIPLPGFGKTHLDLFSGELKHRTSIKNPLDRCSRRFVVFLILKAQRSYNLDPMMIYLAINYIDRYLNSRDFPQGNPIELVATACLSLAAKHLDSATFSIASLKEKDGFRQFDVLTTGKMELQLCGGFGWDPRSITPFAFLHFLVYYFSSTDDEHFQSLKSRASEILFKVQREIEDILEFKPSVIAASALFTAAFEIYPEKFPAFRTDIRSCELIDKEELERCYEAMKEVAENRADKKRGTDGSEGSSANKKRLVDDTQFLA